MRYGECEIVGRKPWLAKFLAGFKKKIHWMEYSTIIHPSNWRQAKIGEFR